MESLKNKIFSGERALFFARDLELKECTFADGESPLKHSRNILIYDTTFNWKYPAWYSEDVRIRDSVLNVTARAGIWYTRDVSLIGCDIQAPKTFRRSFGIRIENCTMPNAEETLWWCSDVKIKNVKAKGNYFAMNASRIEAEGLELDGDYCFDGAKEVTIFFRVVAPLCIPVFAALAVMVAVGHWNSWFDVMLYNASGNYDTLQMLLRDILIESDKIKELMQDSMVGADAVKSQASRISTQSMRAATTMIVTIPIVCVYPFFQRYFVKGISIGAVKG